MPDQKATQYEAPRRIRDYFVMSYSADTPGYKILDYALDAGGRMYSFARYIHNSFSGARWCKNMLVTCDTVGRFITPLSTKESRASIVVVMCENTFQIICRADIYTRYFVKYGYVSTEKDLDA